MAQYEFFGSTYSMVVDKKIYSFGFVNEEKAVIMANEKLEELEIKYDKKIIFEWDETL